MSVESMARVWQMDLPHSELLVMLAMADHADHDGQDIRPSITLIAWKTGYSEQQARRIVHGLVGKGILQVQAQPPGRPRIYRIQSESAPLKPRLDPSQNGTPPKMEPLPKWETPPLTAMGDHPSHSCDTPPKMEPLSQLWEPPPLIAMRDPPSHSYDTLTINKPSINHPIPQDKPVGSGPEKPKQEKSKPETQAFIAGWMDAFRERFRDQYPVTGRDGAAAKRLLQRTGKTAQEVLESAKQAWANKRGWHCQRAITIQYFSDHWVQIRQELGALKPKDEPIFDLDNQPNF